MVNQEGMNVKSWLTYSFELELQLLVVLLHFLQFLKSSVVSLRWSNFGLPLNNFCEFVDSLSLHNTFILQLLLQLKYFVTVGRLVILRGFQLCKERFIKNDNMDFALYSHMDWTKKWILYALLWIGIFFTEIFLTFDISNTTNKKSNNNERWRLRKWRQEQQRAYLHTCYYSQLQVVQSYSSVPSTFLSRCPVSLQPIGKLRVVSYLSDTYLAMGWPDHFPIPCTIRFIPTHREKLSTFHFISKKNYQTDVNHIDLEELTPYIRDVRYCWMIADVMIKNMTDKYIGL